MAGLCVRFLLLLALLPIALGCSCLPATSRRKYCSADFVARVEVLFQDIPPNQSTRVYRIRANTVYFFKPQSTYNIMKTRVYTASNGAMCGVSLTPGQTYLLSGQLQQAGWLRRMRINLCGWNEPWYGLTGYERRVLRRRGPCFVTPARFAIARGK